ncbi:MAG: amidohydrolase family protein [Rhodospirillaceae bacterium]|nr:amidohydrolase family protein [Rhodospirillaceae bacterium]
MKHILKAAFSLVALLSAPAARAETIVITGATIHTSLAPEPVTGATLILRDGRIAALGKDVAVPKDARVIDASGRIVTAGLMASETALGTTEVAAAEATVDNAVTREGRIGPAFDIASAVNPDSVLLSHVRADGLTRAFSVPQRSAVSPFAGQGAILRLNDGPDIIDRRQAAMFVRIGGRAAEQAGGSRAAQWQTLRQGFDEAKLFTPPGRAANESLLSLRELRTLLPVLDGKMPLAVGVSRASDIREAIAIAAAYNLRLIIVGAEEAWRVAPELAARNIPVVMDPGLDHLSTYDNIGARPDAAAMLHKAGVTLAFMTSGGRGTWDAGVALREGAGFAVAAGLPWVEALKAMTINPARVWGIDGHYGAIAPGKDADVVIWDGDPLEVTTAPVAVFVRGQEVSLHTRQKQLSERYSPLRTGSPTAACAKDGCK